MELRLRPQPSGLLQGELVIRQSGFGMTPIEGFVQGDHLQFRAPYGTETYHFEGQRRSDEISGTFESTRSGERGTWTGTPEQGLGTPYGQPTTIEIPPDD